MGNIARAFLIFFPGRKKSGIRAGQVPPRHHDPSVCSFEPDTFCFGIVITVWRFCQDYAVLVDMCQVLLSAISFRNDHSRTQTIHSNRCLGYIKHMFSPVGSENRYPFHDTISMHPIMFHSEPGRAIMFCRYRQK